MSEALDRKLDYLEETKSEIRDAIIRKGQEISSDDTFRSYVAKIADIETGGEILLFPSIEEMNAYENPETDMLAVIYTENGYLDWDNTYPVQYVTFPETVNLNTTVTTNIECILKDNKGKITLTKTGCSIQVKDLSIQYTSTNGKKYIRATTLSEFTNINTGIQVTTETWNINVGKFIQVYDSDFIGLYKYNINKWELVIPLQALNYYLTSQDSIITQQQAIITDLKNILKTKTEKGEGDIKLYTSETIMNQDPYVTEGQLAVVYNNKKEGLKETSKFYIMSFPLTIKVTNEITTNYRLSMEPVISSNLFDGYIELTPSYFKIDFYGEDFNVINIRYTSEDGINYTRQTFNIDGYKTYNNKVHIGFELQNKEGYWNNIFTNIIDVEEAVFIGFYIYDGTQNKYVAAPTQLTVTESTQILTNYSAYGKNTVITGTASPSPITDEEYEELLTISEDILN